MGDKTVVFISDIHGNIDALEKVLDQLNEEEIYCLGDTVGYGPQPKRCVELVRSISSGTIMGNHDAAVAEELDYSSFNPVARRLTDWTRGRLGSEQLRYLQNLPRSLERKQFQLFHGSPTRPLRQYVESPADIQNAFSEADAPVLLGLGHTHKPYLYRVDGENYLRPPASPGEKIKILSGGAVLNPGSVGQPRDGDPRASFARYWPESSEVAFYRVQYNIDRVCKEIEAREFPPFLCERLREGY